MAEAATVTRWDQQQEWKHMDEPRLPARLVEARRTPLFDHTTLPDALANSHRTTVRAQIRVQAGTVRYIDLEGDSLRDERLDAGDGAVIAPGIEHHVEPSTDAQFYREPDAAMVPGVVRLDSLNRSGQWTHRERDLDTEEEIVEMVTRQYFDVGGAGLCRRPPRRTNGRRGWHGPWLSGSSGMGSGTPVCFEKETQVVTIDVSTKLAAAVDEFPSWRASSSAAGWTTAALAASRSAKRAR